MFRKATTSVTLKLAKHLMTSRLLRRTFNDEHRVRQNFVHLFYTKTRYRGVTTQTEESSHVEPHTTSAHRAGGR